MTEPAQPWVLIRKGKPLARFASRELGQKFFDSLRFNSGAQPAGALFGPHREAWYCGGTRWSSWVRDDDRRQREMETEPADDEGTEER